MGNFSKRAIERVAKRVFFQDRHCNGSQKTAIVLEFFSKKCIVRGDGEGSVDRTSM